MRRRRCADGHCSTGTCFHGRGRTARFVTCLHTVASHCPGLPCADSISIDEHEHPHKSNKCLLFCISDSFGRALGLGQHSLEGHVAEVCCLVAMVTLGVLRRGLG